MSNSLKAALLPARPDAALDRVALFSVRDEPRVDAERAVVARAGVAVERVVRDDAARPEAEPVEALLRVGVVRVLAAAAVPRVDFVVAAPRVAAVPVARLDVVPALLRDAAAVVARLAVVPVERRVVVPVARLVAVPVVRLVVAARLDVVPVARLDVVPVARLDVVPVARLGVVPVVRLDVVPVVRLVVVPVARLVVVPVVRLVVVPVVRLVVVLAARALVAVARLAAVPVPRVADERVLAARAVLGADARVVEREVAPAPVLVADARSDLGAARLAAVAPAALPRTGALLEAVADRVEDFAVERAEAVAVRAPRVDARRAPGRIAMDFEPVEEPFASSLLM